jgi:hypothetical protein
MDTAKNRSRSQLLTGLCGVVLMLLALPLVLTGRMRFRGLYQEGVVVYLMGGFFLAFGGLLIWQWARDRRRL